MLTPLVVVALAASPVSVAAPGLTTVGVERQLGEVYLDRFTALLREAGPLKVTTARDLEQVLGLERQRQLLGCESNTSCITELVSAMGVDALLSGSLAKTDSGFFITLRFLRASDGSELATASERLSGEKELGEWLELRAPEMAQKLFLALGRKEDAANVKFRTTTSAVRWVPGIVGAVAAVGGGACFLISHEAAKSLSEQPTSSTTSASIKETAARGRTTQTLAPILVGVGAAGIAASVIWLLVGAPAKTTVAVVPMKDGAAFSVGGTF